MASLHWLAVQQVKIHYRNCWYQGIPTITHKRKIAMSVYHNLGCNTKYPLSEIWDTVNLFFEAERITTALFRQDMLKAILDKAVKQGTYKPY